MNKKKKKKSYCYTGQSISQLVSFGLQIIDDNDNDKINGSTKK